MNKTRRHTIRFTPAEWATIHERAEQCGVSFSAYLRQIGLGSTPRRRRTDLEDQVLYHLGRIGNNLNQIARSANSGIPVPTSEIRESVARINELLETL